MTMDDYSEIAGIPFSTARMLRSGHFLLRFANGVSLALYRADGVDQAKFRVPRQNQKIHCWIPKCCLVIMPMALGRSS